MQGSVRLFQCELLQGKALLCGGVGDRGSNVVTLQVGVVAQDFFFGSAGCQHIQDVLDTDAHAADARATAAFAWFNGDTLEKIRLHDPQVHTKCTWVSSEAQYSTGLGVEQ